MNIVVLVIVAIVLFAVFLKTHSKHKSPARSAIMNMALGVLSLSIVAPLISVTVSVYTVFVTLTLGVPGTLLVVIGNFLT